MKRIKDLILQTWRKEFVRGFFILFSGSSISQAIPLLAVIVLARIFTDDSFGLLFLYSTTVVILSIIGTLKYELAIVLPKNETDSINLLVLSILVCILISTFLLIIVFIFGTNIANLLGDSKIQLWLYFVPLSVFLTGIFQSTNYWFLWQKKYKNISAARIIKAGGTSGTQIITGFSKFVHIGLIPGFITGQFVAAVVNIYISYKTIRTNLKYVSFQRIKKLAYEHRNLPMFSTLLGVSNKISSEMPVLLLTNFYGLAITGYYGMANRLIGTPMGLISQSVSQMFFKKASDIYNAKENLTRFIKRTCFNLFKVGIIPFSLMFVLAPFVVRVALGEDWADVSLYIRILIPWLFIMFVKSPITNIITILRKQKQILVFDVCQLIARFLAIFCGFYFFESPIISIIFFSAVGVIFNIVLLFVLIGYSKRA